MQAPTFEESINTQAEGYLTQAKKATKDTRIKAIAKALDTYVADVVADGVTDDNGATEELLEDLNLVVQGNEPEHGNPFEGVKELVSYLSKRGAYVVEEEPEPVRTRKAGRAGSQSPRTARAASPKSGSASPRTARSQSPRTAPASPAQKRTGKNAPAKQQKKAKAPVNESKLLPVGLELHLPFAKKQFGVNGKLKVEESVFWNGSKPITGFNVDKKIPENLVAAERKKYLRQAKWEMYREPYPGKMLNRVQEFNFKLLDKLSEAIADTAYGFGQYGDNATFTFELKIAKSSRRSYEERKYYVTKADLDHAQLVLSNRIDIGLALERSRSKKAPVDRPTEKDVRTVLTPAAIQWVADEKFTTRFMPKGSRDLKTWLAKKLGVSFEDTFLARGMLTSGNYTKLIHLAVEKNKDFTKAPDQYEVDGMDKLQVGFDYTEAMVELNNSTSVFVYVKNKNTKKMDKRFAGDDSTVTVVDAAMQGDKPYIPDAILLPGIMVLKALTAYSKSFPPESEEQVAFIEGTDLSDEFIKETEAIGEYIELRAPLKAAATKSRNKIVTDKKKAATKASKDAKASKTRKAAAAAKARKARK